MGGISILLMLLLVFSCKQYGDVKALKEIAFENDNFSVGSDNVAVKDLIIEKEPALTSEESKRLQSLKDFLKTAIEANGREEENVKVEYDKSYKEFFDWLSKDINKQKEFIDSFNKIFGIVAKAVDASRQRSRDNQQSLGLEEYVCYKIKISKGEALSLFFQKVADAFGPDGYKKKDDNNNSQKPEKCNEEIFKAIKRVFTEGNNNNELEDLKSYGKV
ncbi:Mlp family lipoprotein [Borreliella turdi]|uniref:Mlp family lipoprotein n=1 Tax=Borreliella turdi TaxID=57863 RepID=UPI002649B893|nr:Mlp family lipoprotein [Borreliella turdi]WKC78475.1 Mlp family lipoprotein [Borreliella turdi]